MAPQVGFEPTAYRLTAGCSTAELLRKVIEIRGREPTSDFFHYIIKFDPTTSYSPRGNPQVPSAQKGLTSLFGMGTGGTPSP